MLDPSAETAPSGSTETNVTADDPGPPGPPARHRLGGAYPAVFAGIASAVVLLDVVTKQLVMHHLTGGEYKPLIGSFLQLTLVRNPGMAFSFLTGYTWVLALIVLGVSVAIVVVSRRCGSLPWTIALGLILGGALGNLGDRFFRDPGFLRGHVVDFLLLPHWPVFNVADSAVTCGAVLVVLLSLMGRTMDGRPAPGSRR